MTETWLCKFDSCCYLIKVSVPHLVICPLSGNFLDSIGKYSPMGVYLCVDMCTQEQMLVEAKRGRWNTGAGVIGGC